MLRRMFGRMVVAGSVEGSSGSRSRPDGRRFAHRIRLADHAVRPGLVLLHHDVAADGPVILAALGVVVVRAPEVRADHHYQPVGHAVLLGVVPQEVHGVRQRAEQPFVVGVVGAVRVEAAEPPFG